MTPTQALETLRHTLLRSSSPGDAAEALEVLARETERADAAEAMVAELRVTLKGYAEREYNSATLSDSFIQHDAERALTVTQPVADRWVPASRVAELERERDEVSQYWRSEYEALANAVDKSMGIIHGSREGRIANLKDPKGELGDFVAWAKNDALNDAGRRIAELERDLAACMEAKSALAGELEGARRSFSEVFRGSQTDRALANKACAERDEVGIQLHAARERLRLAEALRDFAESPPVHWEVSEDRQTMTGRCDDATATLAIDGRVELRRDDGLLLARIDVWPHDVRPGVFMDRADCQCEIAAALLWSHRRSNRIGAVREWDAVPGDESAKKGGES